MSVRAGKRDQHHPSPRPVTGPVDERTPPQSPSADVLALQRSAGNAAVARLLERSHDRRPVLARIGDPQVGDPVPPLRALYGNRAYTLNVPQARKEIVERQFLDSIQGKALQKVLAVVGPAAAGAAVTPDAGHVRQVAEAIKLALPGKPLMDACDAVYLDASLAIPNREQIVQSIVDLFPDEMEEAAVGGLGLETDIAYGEHTSQHGPGGRAVTDPTLRKQLSDALRSIPRLSDLVREVKAGAIQPPPAKARVQPEWLNGGKLGDTVRQEPPQSPPAEDTEIKNGNFDRRLDAVDTFYKRLVEPDVLKTVPRPAIHVHLQRGWSSANPNGFRSYEADGAVHVAQDDPEPIITHEVGHHVENNLPIGRWAEIQTMLRARHAATPGATVTEDVQGEARYAGEYPATGTYTSRAKGDAGYTEVTSMTLQHLDDPSEVDRLLDEDPVQLAVIVRMLRPFDWQAFPKLRVFDPLLP